MANVTDIEKWVKLEGQGHKVKIFGTNKNSKDMANVKVFADRRTGQKLYVPNLLIRDQHKNFRSVCPTSNVPEVLKYILLYSL
jgi:hypothetical protein